MNAVSFGAGKDEFPVGDINLTAAKAHGVNPILKINLIIRQEEQDRSNDVVIVYFQGEALYKDKRYYLMTNQTLIEKDYQSSAVTLKELRRTVSGNVGAQLLLIDVLHREQKKPEEKEVTLQKQRLKQLGELHYAWLRKEDPPKQKRLLQNLKASLSRGKTLGEVSQAVKKLAEAQKEEKLLPLVLYVPNSIASVRFGN